VIRVSIELDDFKNQSRRDSFSQRVSTAVADKLVDEVQRRFELEVRRAVLNTYTDEEIQYYGPILSAPSKLAEAIIAGYKVSVVPDKTGASVVIEPNEEKLAASGVSGELLYALEYGSVSLSGIRAPLRTLIAAIESHARSKLSN